MPNVPTVVPIAGVALPRNGINSFGYQRTDAHRHQGIDLHAPVGTPVMASFSGTVEHVATELVPGFSGYGRVVVIRSEPDDTPNGVEALWCLYAHLDEILVKVGDYVIMGQEIASVGDTCFKRGAPSLRCTRSHLHFEISPRAYPQDSEAPRLNPVPLLTGFHMVDAEEDTERHPAVQAQAEPRKALRRGALGLVLMAVTALVRYLWNRFQ